MARTKVSARKSASGGKKKLAVVRPSSVDVPVRYIDVMGAEGTLSVKATPSMGAYEVARSACKTLGAERAPFERAYASLSVDGVAPVAIVEKIRHDRKCTPASSLILPRVREGGAARGLNLTFGDLPPLNANAWKAYKNEPAFTQWIDAIAMGGPVKVAGK